MTPKTVNLKVVGRGYTDGVYIGRPSVFGNPFTVGKDGTREEVIAAYEKHLQAHPEIVEQAKRDLPGRNLICWCAPLACHGDVLLKLANGLLDPEDIL